MKIMQVQTVMVVALLIWCPLTIMLLCVAPLPPLPTPFFFQAEDGIRDGTVTGVQTCALPILGYPNEAQLSAILTSQQYAARKGIQFTMRSEERRVGKECRSRWSAYH